MAQEISTEGLTPDQRQDLARKLTTDSNLQNMLNGMEAELEEDFSPELGAMLAGTGTELKAGYPLGNGFLPPAPMGTFALLAMMKSPLLGLTDDDEGDFIDAYRAVYVICRGSEALQPIFGLSHRVRELKGLKSLYKTPEGIDRLASLIDKAVHSSWAEIDKNALDFIADEFGEVLPSQVMSTAMLVLTDATVGLTMLQAGSPEPDDPKKKAL